MPFRAHKKHPVSPEEISIETVEEATSLGQIIKAQREKLGFSISDVSEKTKIRKAFIIAIENDDFDQLPGKVYIKGFLGTYMTLLGLSSDLIDQQNQTFKSQLQIKPSPFKFYVYKEESTSISQKIILISLALALSVWVLSKIKTSQQSLPSLNKESVYQDDNLSLLTPSFVEEPKKELLLAPKNEIILKAATEQLKPTHNSESQSSTSSLKTDLQNQADQPLDHSVPSTHSPSEQESPEEETASDEDD